MKDSTISSGQIVRGGPQKNTSPSLGAEGIPPKLPDLKLGKPRERRSGRLEDTSENDIIGGKSYL